MHPADPTQNLPATPDACARDGFSVILGGRRGSGRSDAPDVDQAADAPTHYPDLVCVHSREQLRVLADELGVRSDWHEPDEQDVSAQVHGTDFDNAMGSGDGLARPLGPRTEAEMNVLLLRDGEPYAAVNLATLLAWACEA